MKTDPFTIAYEGLWALLETWEPFTELVKSGNRIKYVGSSRNPEKPEVSDGDMPEVRIIPVSTLTHVKRTSNLTSCLQKFEIGISTGDQRLHVRHFPVKWAILRALTNWQASLTILTWNGKTFIKIARPTEVSEGVSEFDANRNIRGWSSVWSCELEMFFTTTDMIDKEI